MADTQSPNANTVLQSSDSLSNAAVAELLLKYQSVLTDGKTYVEIIKVILPLAAFVFAVLVVLIGIAFYNYTKKIDDLRVDVKQDIENSLTAKASRLDRLYQAASWMNTEHTEQALSEMMAFLLEFDEDIRDNTDGKTGFILTKGGY